MNTVVTKFFPFTVSIEIDIEAKTGIAVSEMVYVNNLVAFESFFLKRRHVWFVEKGQRKRLQIK